MDTSNIGHTVYSVCMESGEEGIKLKRAEEEETHVALVLHATGSFSDNTANSPLSMMIHMSHRVLR